MGKHKNVKWNCLYNYRVKKYESFEEMLQAFLIDSQDRLKALKQHTKRKLHIKTKRRVLE